MIDRLCQTDYRLCFSQPIPTTSPNYPHTNFQWHTKISTCFQFNSSVYSEGCLYGLDLEREGQAHQKY